MILRNGNVAESTHAGTPCNGVFTLSETEAETDSDAD